MRILWILIGLLPAVAAAGGLRDALERAWERDTEARALEAREAELQARDSAAGSLLPAPPAVAVTHRTDQWNNDLGRREWEADIDLPLWLPGQQRARLGQAGAERGEWQAALAERRLALAGELRRLVWAVALADSQARLARQRLVTAQALERDVGRRVQAGDLAHADLLLARNETLTTQSAVLGHAAALAQALERYRAFTGDSAPPPDRDEPAPAATAPDTHPRLEAARTAIAAAQAKARVVRESPRDPPELQLVTGSERDAFGESYRQRIGIRLRLPFATEARNRPLLTEAETALTRAQAAYRQTQVAVEAEIRQARQALQAALEQSRLAEQQRNLAAEHLRLKQKAFDLGELDLPSLMRVRTLAWEAEAAWAQQTMLAGAARGTLNQALGVLP